MTTVQLIDRRWYRIALHIAAVSATLFLLYFVAVGRGLLPGEVGPRSVLLQLASSCCLLWGFVMWRRSTAAFGALVMLSIILLAWSVVSLTTGN
jgi:hypothetical protein